jgi:hypothetical protein
LGEIPERHEVNVKVLVNEKVTQSSDSLPRDFRVLGTEVP